METTITIIIKIIFIFLFGSIMGWIIETIYRSIFNKKLVNPGFLTGPYLPIYGFGILILFYVSKLNIIFFLKLILFALTTTLLELLTGLLFTKYYNIKLWDYSKEKLNFKGIICPLYSFYWTLIALLFYLFLFPGLNKLYLSLKINLTLTIFIFLLSALFLFDLSRSLKVAFKIKSYLKEFNKEKIKQIKINYEKFKQEITTQFNRCNKIKWLEKFSVSSSGNLKKDFFQRLNQLINKIK